MAWYHTFAEYFNHRLVLSSVNLVGFGCCIAFLLLWIVNPKSTRKKVIFARFSVFMALDGCALFFVMIHDVASDIAARGYFRPQLVGMTPILCIASTFTYGCFASATLTCIHLMRLTSDLTSRKSKRMLRAQRLAMNPRFTHYVWEWVIVAVVGVTNGVSAWIPGILLFIGTLTPIPAFFTDLPTYLAMCRAFEQLLLCAVQLAALLGVLSLFLVSRNRRSLTMYLAVIASLFIPNIVRAASVTAWLGLYFVKRVATVGIAQWALDLVFSVLSYAFVIQVCLVALFFGFYMVTLTTLDWQQARRVEKKSIPMTSL